MRLPMLGLAVMWAYDLHLYTIAYLGAPSAPRLFEWRGRAVALIAPLFALGARNERAGGSRCRGPRPSSRSR